MRPLLPSIGVIFVGVAQLLQRPGRTRMGGDVGRQIYLVYSIAGESGLAFAKLVE
jgi:hypothetical protein